MMRIVMLNNFYNTTTIIKSHLGVQISPVTPPLPPEYNPPSSTTTHPLPIHKKHNRIMDQHVSSVEHYDSNTLVINVIQMKTQMKTLTPPHMKIRNSPSDFLYVERRS